MRSGILQQGKDMSLAVYEDDSTLCGLEEDLLWVKGSIQRLFDLKVRSYWGQTRGDDKDVLIPGKGNNRVQVSGGEGIF